MVTCQVKSNFWGWVRLGLGLFVWIYFMMRIEVLEISDANVRLHWEFSIWMLEFWKLTSWRSHFWPFKILKMNANFLFEWSVQEYFINYLGGNIERIHNSHNNFLNSSNKTDPQMKVGWGASLKWVVFNLVIASSFISLPDRFGISQKRISLINFPVNHPASLPG